MGRVLSSFIWGASCHYWLIWCASWYHWCEVCLVIINLRCFLSSLINLICVLSSLIWGASCHHWFEVCLVIESFSFVFSLFIAMRLVINTPCLVIVDCNVSVHYCTVWFHWRVQHVSLFWRCVFSLQIAVRFVIIVSCVKYLRYWSVALCLENTALCLTGPSFFIIKLIYCTVATMFWHYGIDFLLGCVDHVLHLWHWFTALCLPCFAIMELIFCLAFSTMFCHYGTYLGRRMRRVAHVLSLWH